MGTLQAAALRAAAVLLHCGVFCYILAYHAQPTRRWCTHDWVKTDCLGEKGMAARNANRTALQIVLPSYGQTGTTSVITALRELGYRSFHADDYSVFSRSLMWDNRDPHIWAKGVTRCRMEAMSLEPVTDILPVAVKMSPKAQFIMTWRSFPSWHKSTTGSRVKEIRWGVIHEAIQLGNRLLPWVETWDYLFETIKRVRQEGQPYPWDNPVTSYVYRTVCNGYSWPQTHVLDRGTFKSKAAEEAYLGHINEIRMLVPKDRLLEFDVSRHSWAELDQFLGQDSGRAGTPFPHPRTKDLRTNEVIMESNLHTIGWALYLFCAMHALNFWLLGVLLWLLCWLLWLLAWLLGIIDWPLEGCRQRWEAALQESPLVAVLDGVEPEAVVPLGRALAAAGFRALALPLGTEEAAQSLRQLVAALPECAVGGSVPPEGGDVQAVYDARGHFVLNPFAHRAALRRARGLGLASLSGACTPSEALAACRAGADGVLATAPRPTPPGRVRACRDCLAPGAPVLVWLPPEAEALEDYWAAGAGGFALGGAALLRPGEPLSEAAARAGALLAACRAARG